LMFTKSPLRKSEKGVRPIYTLALRQESSFREKECVLFIHLLFAKSPLRKSEKGVRPIYTLALRQESSFREKECVLLIHSLPAAHTKKPCGFEFGYKTAPQNPSIYSNRNCLQWRHVPMAHKH
jgi:hypothetical protein